MKNKKLIVGLSLGLALLISIFTVAYFMSKDETKKGEKNISVTVIFSDKSEKDYDINTNAEYLVDALLEEQIIEKKNEDGMYTVISGERADYNLDKSWWCITKSGEMTNEGMNTLPISDGDKFEITNTPS